MRKLLYPFLLCVSLIACNGIHYGSDKAFTLSDMDYSVLLSMEKEQLDSVIRIGKKHYPSGHDEAFRLGQIEFVYYYHRLDDKRRADSLANELRFCIKDTAIPLFGTSISIRRSGHWKKRIRPFIM